MTSIRVVDVETTGLDPAVDDVIEIAAVDVRYTIGGHGKLDSLSARSNLIWTDTPIPPQASAVHHIVDADLKGKPRLDEVMGLYEGADVYVAHHAQFDAGFLPNLGPWICTWKCAMRQWPDAPGFSNQVLRYWLGMIEIYGIDRDRARMHRAGPDTLVTAAILGQLLDHVDLETLRQWSGEPARLPYFTFGKHAMQPIADVPTGYLKWMEGQDFDEDVRFTVAMEMERRRG